MSNSSASPEGTFTFPPISVKIFEMAKTARETKQRKNIRFNPDQGAVAQVCFGTKTFKPDHHALILSESYRGCSIVLTLAPDVAVGDRLRIKVGNLAPMLAEVRWVIPLDDEIQKIGFMYLQ